MDFAQILHGKQKNIFIIPVVLTNMEERTAKINAVKTVLDSFADSLETQDVERKAHLRTIFPSNRHLKTYFNYTFEKLQVEKKQLQEVTTSVGFVWF